MVHSRKEGLVHSGQEASIPGGDEAGGAGHTPGPWKVFTVKDGPNKGQLLGIGEESGAGVTDAHGGLWGSGDEKMANARLIAAAPELLEALANMEAACERLAAERSPQIYGLMIEQGQSANLLALDEARRAARSAISKAVGDVKRDADPIHRRDGDAASGAVNQASLPSQSEVG